MRCLLYTSLLAVICLIACSCSTNSLLRSTGAGGIAEIGAGVKKYEMNLSFGKKHFNGQIAVCRMNTGETRIIGYTPFGLSLFDFGLEGESFRVYSCIEPMRHKKLLRILEQDFKLLFLPDRKVNNMEVKNNCIKFADGKFFTKRIVICTKDDLTGKRHILIRRPWVKLNIELKELKEEHATE